VTAITAAAFARLSPIDRVSGPGGDVFFLAGMGLTAAALPMFQWRQTGSAVDRLISYQITMGPNVLRIAMLGMLPTEILRTSVRKIEEHGNGLRIIYDGGLIGVPRSLPDYAEVRARLSSWAAIQVRSRRQILTVLAALAGFAAVLLLLIGDRIPLGVRLPVQVALLVTLGIGIDQLRRTRLDAKQKSQLIGVSGFGVIWIVAQIVMEVSRWLRMK
jgi:hypothetical protein